MNIMQPPHIIRPIKRGQVITGEYLSKLAKGLNQMNAGVFPPWQDFNVPLTPPPLSCIRTLTLLNAPATQMSESSPPYPPYPLPDVYQYFTAASLRFFCISASPVSIYYGGLWHLFSLDANGVIIEQVQQTTLNGILGSVSLYNYGTIHGNNYWANPDSYGNPQWNLTSNTGRAITAPVYICGWQSTMTDEEGDTVLWPPVITGIIAAPII